LFETRSGIVETADKQLANKLFWWSKVEKDDFAAVIYQAYQEELLDRAIEHAKTSVSNEQWDVFWSQWSEGRQAKEVAAGFGISLANAYVIKSRVLGREFSETILATSRSGKMNKAL